MMMMMMMMMFYGAFPCTFLMGYYPVADARADGRWRVAAAASASSISASPANRLQDLQPVDLAAVD